MLKRKIDKILLQWKKSKDRDPLIIKGARQIGKTFSVLNFAKENYENHIYLNFTKNPEYSTIFSGNLDIDNLIMLITSYDKNAKAVPYKTLIIFDEIQDCPNARTSLKFFKEDGRYDVIATGSLLGVNGYSNKERSIPVGSEKNIDMHSLDFEEFLWANNVGEDIIDSLKKSLSNLTPIHEALNKRMMDLFKQYICIGGMPEVVKAFLDSYDMNNVLEVQKKIISSYKDDVIKYAPVSEKSKVRLCFESIPNQLAKENKKFQYSLFDKKSNAKKYEGALQWLVDAGIISLCHNLSITELPLKGNAIDNIFKVYMKDSGLFVSMLEKGTQGDILQGNLLVYKGAIFENIIADVFSKMGRELYYFRKDSGLEIDFVTRYKGECIIIEVKSTNGNIKSAYEILNNFNRYHVKKCIKFIDGNINVNNNIISLPLYMSFLLLEY